MNAQPDLAQIAPPRRNPLQRLCSALRIEVPHAVAKLGLAAIDTAAIGGVTVAGFGVFTGILKLRELAPHAPYANMQTAVIAAGGIFAAASSLTYTFGKTGAWSAKLSERRDAGRSKAGLSPVI